MEPHKTMGDIKAEVIARCHKMQKKKLAGRLEACLVFSKDGDLLRNSTSIEAMAQGGSKLEVTLASPVVEHASVNTAAMVAKPGIPVKSHKRRKQSLLSEVCLSV
jgi:hypothetical protein